MVTVSAPKLKLENGESTSILDAEVVSRKGLTSAESITALGHLENIAHISRYDRRPRAEFLFLCGGILMLSSPHSFSGK